MRPVPHCIRYCIVKERDKRNVVSRKIEYQVIIQAVLTVERDIRHIFLIAAILRNIVRRTLMRTRLKLNAAVFVNRCIMHNLALIFFD